MKARTSKQVVEAIDASYALHPDTWGLFHSAKWLGEEIESRRAEIRQFAKTTIAPTIPGVSQSVAACAILHRVAVANHQHPLAELEAALHAVETDPEFGAATSMFEPLYTELAAAQASEDAEVARLQLEAAELAERAAQAEAEAAQKIEAARGPVQKLRDSAAQIAQRIAAIRG